MISEAVGLWTAGTLFPELRWATRWQTLGARLFAEGIRDQLAEDGSHIQHSSNYQRMVLHLGLWALRLGELYRFGWDAVFGKIVLRAARHILRMTERTSGRVPNQGPNDGSLVLDLAPMHLATIDPLCKLHFVPRGVLLRLLPDLGMSYRPGYWVQAIKTVIGKLRCHQRRVPHWKNQVRVGGIMCWAGTTLGPWFVVPDTTDVRFRRTSCTLTYGGAGRTWRKTRVHICTMANLPGTMA